MFFLWEYGQEQSFIDNINKMHSTIKFMTVRSKTSLHFSDVTDSITEGIIESDLYLNLWTVTISFVVFLTSFLLQKGYTIQIGTKA